MKDPLVSVIIPAYNCAHTIEKSIDSALAQDVSMEILVINDASPDDLDAVMEQYAAVPELIYRKNEQNLGVAETRNRAVAMAGGHTSPSWTPTTTGWRGSFGGSWRSWKPPAR